MKYTVTVSTKGVPDSFRFVFPTEEEALETVDRLEHCMKGMGRDCIRIQNTVLQDSIILATHYSAQAEKKP